jgi:hypothetical protein
MFSDASGVGYGRYIAKEAGKSMLGEVYGAWDAPEACMSSTWRELEAVNRVLKSNAESLIGVSLKVYTDNKNVETILHKNPCLYTPIIAVVHSTKAISLFVTLSWYPL